MSPRGKPDFSEAFAHLKSLYGEDDISQTRAAVKPNSGPLASIGTVNGPIYFLGQVSPADLSAVLDATKKSTK